MKSQVKNRHEELLAAMSAIGNNSLLAMDVRVAASTTITIKTVLTTGIGSISYASIIKLY